MKFETEKVIKCEMPKIKVQKKNNLYLAHVKRKCSDKIKNLSVNSAKNNLTHIELHTKENKKIAKL